MLVNLDVFHFEMSGKFNNEKQLENKFLILVTFDVFHMEISGKWDNDEQPEKR